MASASLQSPQIISLQGSVLRIAHPDVSRNLRTSLVSEFTTAGTSISVADNNGFSDNDFLILGEPAESHTEEVDINQAVEAGTGKLERGGTMTITNTTDFDHEIHTPIIKIQERGIRIYGATTDGGSGTLLASVDALTAVTSIQLADTVMIQWNRPYTEWNILSTDTTYDFYYVTFHDGTTESAASVYVPAAGFTSNRVINIIDSALDEVNAQVDGEKITYRMLLSWANDWQEAVKRYVTPNGIKKDWTFEYVTDDTTLAITENENEYALSGLTPDLKYTMSHEAILNLRIGSTVPLQFIDLDQIDKDFQGVVRGTLASDTVVGATTITLTDSTEFADDGSVLVGPDTLTYTDNDTATGILSGIPVSGDGSITAITTSGGAVWQGISAGTPSKYTIRSNRLVFNLPPESDLEDFPIKIKYIGELARFTSISNSVSVVPNDHGKYFIAGRIEDRKGNMQNAERMMNMFRERLAQEAVKDGLPMLEAQDYYTFHGGTDGSLVGELS